ncbi:hypothetical protein Q7689_00080 [Nocardiopsis tropica]|uniref:hypothetical protein n=1 Tax=Nocardiopsis tropica TaxID=109330 RepID=UPI002E8B99C7|nr:hypothetical protein [Nocardiopsis tropica]
MSLDQMGFRDFLEAHRRNIAALEAAYEAGIDGTGTLSELTELFDDAGFSLVLARSKATADLRDLERASAGDMVPEDVDGLPQDLIDAITADAEDGLTDPATLHQVVPEEDAAGELAAADGSRVTKWVPAGDLLAAFDDGPRDLPDRDTYRADHPFPIDDEEVQW